MLVQINRSLGESIFPRPVSHAIFNRGNEATNLESEDTFVQYVAATQDLASTQVEDKVGRWLQDQVRDKLQHCQIIHI